MTPENDHPLYARAARAPWREILRQRWSGRRDRALVLQDRDGGFHLVGPRNRSATPPGHYGAPMGPAAPRKTLRGYDGAFLVQLDERSGTRNVALPTAQGTDSVELRVLWWVYEPVQTVRTRTTHGWAPVRKDLDQRVRRLVDEYAAGGHRLGTPGMAQHLAAPQMLPDRGLAYRVSDISARESDDELRPGQAGEVDLPYSWNADRREEYEFCVRAVRSGPASLAALWLLRHPDQVSQVLGWVVDHRTLIRGETNWQDEMAALLATLTSQERQELSELLRDRLANLGRRVPPRGDSPVEQVPPPTGVNGWSVNLAGG
ncbi:MULTISPECIES: hypothetical protein [Streptomycetaceae]|nr:MULTISPECIES: hypothetical protein [Streptomycetaceae]